MKRWHAPASAVALACVAAGCGFGSGPSSSGTATLTVTRDYGSRTLVGATESDPRSSETVIRMLDREADIATRYGGGFVQSINGLSGGESDGRRYDWFFYVNGIESSVGAAQVHVRGGDRIWWDYRDWTDAMRVPAVVGSWPEPFAQASESEERDPVRIVCLDGGRACDIAAQALRHAGVRPAVDRGNQGGEASAAALRLVIGRWAHVRDDGAVDGVRGGLAQTGVFAAFHGPTDGRYHLVALDPSGDPVRDLGAGAGLVAALRPGDDPPTWIVTGSSTRAVRRAASLLDERSLRDRYAVAQPAMGGPIPLPLGGEESG
jgi:rhodanese-related sulfurtransferase